MYKGIIVSCDGNGFFRVKLENSETIVLCRLSGKMNQNKIKVVSGDRVQVEVDAASDQKCSRGRIMFRERT